MFFYQFGYLYKTKIEGKIRINTILYFFILFVIQIIFLKLEGKLSYVAVYMQFNNKILITPVIVSVTGILFWVKISELLKPTLGDSKVINYISNNTYDIMQHNLFCVFLINVLFYKLSDIFNLSGFNIERFSKTIYYCYTAGVMQFQIIYTIIAISIPLFGRYLYDKVKNRIKVLKLEVGGKS